MEEPWLRFREGVSSRKRLRCAKYFSHIPDTTRRVGRWGRFHLFAIRPRDFDEFVAEFFNSTNLSRETFESPDPYLWRSGSSPVLVRAFTWFLDTPVFFINPLLSPTLNGTESTNLQIFFFCRNLLKFSTTTIRVSCLRDFETTISKFIYCK